MKNILILSLLLILIIGCKKDQFNEIETSDLQSFLPYELLRDHKTAHYINEPGEEMIFDIQRTIHNNYFTCQADDYRITREEFNLVRRDNSSQRITMYFDIIELTETCEVTGAVFVSINDLSNLSDILIIEGLGNAQLTFPFPEAVAFFNLDLFEEMSFLDKTFKNVFTNIITNPNPIFSQNTRLYYTKENGVVAFTAAQQNTWVLDRYEK